MLISVDIAYFAIHAESGLPLIVLKERHGDRTLSVAITVQDASVIAAKALDISETEKLSSELVATLITQLGGTLLRIVLVVSGKTDIAAKLYLRHNGAIKIVGCNPADAVMLSFAKQMPLFAEDTIFNRDDDCSQEGEQNLKQSIYLSNTIDFGSYHLE